MKIKELLTDKTKWTQHAAARDSYGCIISPTDHRAEAFCLLGAARRCYGYEEEGDEIVTRMNYELGCNLTTFNDSGITFDDVKAFVERLDI